MSEISFHFKVQSLQISCSTLDMAFVIWMLQTQLFHMTLTGSDFVIFLPAIRHVHLLFFIKPLDRKFTHPSTKELSVVVFCYIGTQSPTMQPSISLLLLFHAKGRNGYPQVAGIKHFRAGTPIISIMQVH